MLGARLNAARRGALYLAARGVQATPEALAGAVLEAERDVLITRFLTKK